MLERGLEQWLDRILCKLFSHQAISKPLKFEKNRNRETSGRRGRLEIFYSESKFLTPAIW
ncbi:hypothetical protein NC651_010780 [Populus alba x Populus x berolinensis]|nr:hypothetical protein NC651_010780 [Populus alba x Populus x berolinensis]